MCSSSHSTIRRLIASSSLVAAFAPAQSPFRPTTPALLTQVTTCFAPVTFTGLVNIEGTTKRHGTTGSVSYTVCVSRI